MKNTTTIIAVLSLTLGAIALVQLHKLKKAQEFTDKELKTTIKALKLTTDALGNVVSVMS